MMSLANLFEETLYQVLKDIENNVIKTDFT